MKLEGKRALITGADSGIGRATAILFAQEGADVAITYNTDATGIGETAARVEAAGRRALVIQDDVGDPASVARTFDTAARDLGTLDILINNAGQAMGGMEVAEMDDAVLERILRVNLMAPLFCARAFIRMRRAAAADGKPAGGKIVIVSSVAQHLPTPGSAPYGMSKAGVGSLCRSLSRVMFIACAMSSSVSGTGFSLRRRITSASSSSRSAIARSIRCRCTACIDSAVTDSSGFSSDDASASSGESVPSPVGASSATMPCIAIVTIALSSSVSLPLRRSV